MSKLVLGLLLFVTQLSGPGAKLPQVLQPEFKAAGPAGALKAGQPGEVTVSFNLTKGFAINYKPPISLKLTKISGVTLSKTDFETPTEDPWTSGGCRNDSRRSATPPILRPLAARCGRI